VVHVGEVGTLDQHVARVDGLPEVDDGAIPFVVVGDLAGVLALHDADGAVAKGALSLSRLPGSGGDPGRKDYSGAVSRAAEVAMALYDLTTLPGLVPCDVCLLAGGLGGCL